MVSTWSGPPAVGGSGSLMVNCDQLPLTLTAFANSPPSTLYCTTAIGACELVADPVNRKSNGTCGATIGDGNTPSPIAGAIGGMSRTMNVVEAGRVTEIGISGPWLKEALALSDTCTNDPHGVDELIVPVHCQLVSLVKVPATTWPPGPNCTVMLLPVFLQLDGTDHEMLPRS